MDSDFSHRTGSLSGAGEGPGLSSTPSFTGGCVSAYKKALICSACSVVPKSVCRSLSFVVNILQQMICKKKLLQVGTLILNLE